MPLKWASTSTNLAAIQCHCESTWHSLFFSKQLKRSGQSKSRSYLLRIDFHFRRFRPRANLVEQQIQICIVIGSRLPDVGEIVRAGSAFCRWITKADGHFMAILSALLRSCNLYLTMFSGFVYFDVENNRRHMMQCFLVKVYLP